jgi:hypothetical protein
MAQLLRSNPSIKPTKNSTGPEPHQHRPQGVEREDNGAAFAIAQGQRARISARFGQDSISRSTNVIDAALPPVLQSPTC